MSSVYCPKQSSIVPNGKSWAWVGDMMVPVKQVVYRRDGKVIIYNNGKKVTK